MAEAITCASEFDGDERLPSSDPVESSPILEHIVDHVLAHDQRQEFVQHQPVVMPCGQLARMSKGILPSADAVCARVIHGVVVKEDERAMQTSQDHVFVIARVADDGSAVR